MAVLKVNHLTGLGLNGVPGPDRGEPPPLDR
jgi:hypothetical protein